MPARVNLVQPKPDFAFGLKYDLESTMYMKLRQWQDKSIPPVDAFVYTKFPMPFLILESKSARGSIGTAENQLANAMIKAHDILCSLNVQDRLYVLGMVQVQYHVDLYISFSLREIDGDGKPFTKKVCTTHPSVGYHY